MERPGPGPAGDDEAAGGAKGEETEDLTLTVTEAA